MIRILIALCVGAVGGTYLLAARGLEYSLPLGILAAIITTFALLVAAIGAVALRQPSAAAIVARARQSGRVLAGRVERVDVTGPDVGGRRPVVLDLFVASYPEAPFHAQTSTMLRPEEVSRFEVGNLVTVAHPNPRNNEIALDRSAVSTAQREHFTRSRASLEPSTLPPPKRSSVLLKIGGDDVAGITLRVVLYAIAFGIGAAVGIGVGLTNPDSPLRPDPMPSTSQPSETPSEKETPTPTPTPSPSPTPTPVEQSTTEVDMFDPERVQQALDEIAAEVGHDEVFRITLFDSYLYVEVATAEGADTADRIGYRYGRIMDREPAPIQPREADVERFRMADVDVDAAFALAERIPEFTARHDIDEQELTHITIEMDDAGFYGGILTMRMYTGGDYRSMMIVADSTGDVIRENTS